MLCQAPVQDIECHICRHSTKTAGLYQCFIAPSVRANKCTYIRHIDSLWDCDQVKTGLLSYFNTVEMNYSVEFSFDPNFFQADFLGLPRDATSALVCPWLYGLDGIQPSFHTQLESIQTNIRGPTI